MIAVVVIGLVMGGIVVVVRLKQRHDYFLSRAQYHSEMEIACQRHRDAVMSAISYGTSLIEQARHRRMSDWPFLERVKADMPRLLKDLARDDRRIPYYAAMARKYRHATRYPWLPIEPDPAEPEWSPSSAKADP
jgi:hypothetical protein